MQLDARNVGVLLGAAILIGALWAPWYVLDMAAARDALGATGTPQIPGVLGQFVRELAAALPDKISADAWDVFERGDVPSQLIAVSWGPWLALGGAALIIVASRIGGSETPEAAPAAAIDWFARSAQLERARAAGSAPPPSP